MKVTRSDPCPLDEAVGPTTEVSQPRARVDSAATKPPRAVDLMTYGNQIMVFYACIEVRRHDMKATKLEWVDFPWKVLLEQRERTPFPLVSRTCEQSLEANRLIEILNTTEDVLVFKIAMNTLIRLVQGERAVLLYPGNAYHPDLLEETVRLSEEE